VTPLTRILITFYIEVNNQELPGVVNIGPYQLTVGQSNPVRLTGYGLDV
jgi:hypothetical protein